MAHDTPTASSPGAGSAGGGLTAPPPSTAQPSSSSAPSQHAEATTGTPDAARLSPPPPPSAQATAAAASASAQGRTAAGPRKPAPGAAGSPAADKDDDDSKSPMAWLSATVRVGYGHINSGSLDNPTYDPTVAAKLEQLAAFAADGALSASELQSLPAAVRSKIPPTLNAQELSEFVSRVTKGTQQGACTPVMPTCTTPERNGVHVGLIFHVGGDGFGWDAEPYIFHASDVFSVGMYTGPKFDFHLANPLFLGVGLGAKVAYVAAEGWRYGADVYGRIPVHLTYYVAPNFALEVEGAFGAGVSGYATEPRDYIITTAPEFKFGTARSWDITFGFRFP
jgi:hypothetical protein